MTQRKVRVSSARAKNAPLDHFSINYSSFVTAIVKSRLGIAKSSKSPDLSVKICLTHFESFCVHLLTVSGFSPVAFSILPLVDEPVGTIFQSEQNLLALGFPPLEQAIAPTALLFASTVVRLWGWQVELSAAVRQFQLASALLPFVASSTLTEPTAKSRP